MAKQHKILFTGGHVQLPGGARYSATATFKGRQNRSGEYLELPEGHYDLDLSTGTFTPGALVQNRYGWHGSFDRVHDFHYRAKDYSSAAQGTGIRISKSAYDLARAIAQKVPLRGRVTLEVNYGNKASWMDTAFGDLGVKETPGTGVTDRIVKDYFEASGFWHKDDSRSKDAWCGSFAAFVFKSAGIAPPKESFRVSEWTAFGNTIPEPTFGCVALKTRRGGGHIGFVVGSSPYKDKLYILGGNQNNSVNIAEYKKSDFYQFRLPSAYDDRRDWLPVYNGLSDTAGSEA